MRGHSNNVSCVVFHPKHLLPASLKNIQKRQKKDRGTFSKVREKIVATEDGFFSLSLFF